MKPTASTPPVDPIRLWLVDDNEHLRTLLAELLAQNSGVECTHSFGSASAALSALASKTGTDVVLLDIHMGRENGLDAVRSIRSLSRFTRVLMLTTFFDSQAKSRAMDDGASGFLLKHDSVEQTLESIHQAISLPGPKVKRRRRSTGQEALPPSSMNPRVKPAWPPKFSKAVSAQKPLIQSWSKRIRGIWN